MLFDPSIWLPVIRDIVSSAVPLLFVVVLVRLGVSFIVSAATGDSVFRRR